jgi:hypothetical protein
MIKLSGGWVSVHDVQTIVPSNNAQPKGPSVAQLRGGEIQLKESADDAAMRVNEVRAALAVIRTEECEDFRGAIALVLSLATGDPKKEADNEAL